MHRRTFFKYSSTALAAAGLPKFSSTMDASISEKSQLIKPRPVQQGATIALIAPASPPANAKFDKAYENLGRLGFTIKPGQNMRAVNGHLAGTDAERVADIHAAFSDPEVEAIWCVRGGYGCARLLPLLDYNLIKRHPKVLIGYSDVTALHIAISQKTGLVTFHGQVAGGDFTEFTLGHLNQTLLQPQHPQRISVFDPALQIGDEYRPLVVHPGKAQGPVIGGNLTILASLIGTPCEARFKNKIVCIEEIGEAPYRLDRLLTQLLQASDLKQAAGIALGIFSDCEQKGDTPSLKMKQVLTERLQTLGIPVLYGLPFGHISNQCVLPMGVQATLDTETMSLTLTERSVVR